MRRHTKASSSRSKPRRPGGASPPSGRLRLFLLLATAAAFLLVPAAQAMANETMFVEIEGTGSGEVTSVGGAYEFGAPGVWEGTPPIKCHKPSQLGDVCENEMEENKAEGEGYELDSLHAISVPGSEFAGWTVILGESLNGCGTPECLAGVETGGGPALVVATFEKIPTFKLTVKKTGTGTGTVESNVAGVEGEKIVCGSHCAEEYEENTNVVLSQSADSGSKFKAFTGCDGTFEEGKKCSVKMSKAKEVTVEFEKEGPSGLPLKVTHEGAGSGTIQSSPAGITCTSGECEGSFAENEVVTLTASPAAGSAFTAWKNCDSKEVIPGVTGVHGRQCTVKVTPGHKTVGAKFEPANTVTVKTKGNGTGSVSGVTCGNTCTEASGIFLASKAVTLKAKPYAKNSEFKGWTASPVSCTLSEEGKTCSLGLLSANETVEAEFAEIARENLKITKSGGGQGLVKSAPAGINCSYTCPSNTAYFYKGTSVTLTASVQAEKGSALGNWGGACAGTAATPCVVSMSEAKEVTVEFK